jgi:hypothetical protein
MTGKFAAEADTFSRIQIALFPLPPASYTVGTGFLFHGGKIVGVVKQTTHLYSLLKNQKYLELYLHYPHVFVTCSMSDWDKFPLAFFCFSFRTRLIILQLWHKRCVQDRAWKAQ